jgi:hypothetical protein
MPKVIREHDRVVLRSLLPITASSLAMLDSRSHFYQVSYEVEFITLAGQTAAIVILQPTKLGRSLINERELAHRSHRPGDFVISSRRCESVCRLPWISTTHAVRAVLRNTALGRFSAFASWIPTYLS